ncbi:MAG TPA: threonine--tRNA ligase [Candidatus Saccharimonadales bacterium]|nr:threonine--tRNA ligase [Candidatus Saccharimonadales bacterium]
MSEDKNDHLHAMRHSLAHIMANAIQHLWPEAKFGVGPVVENGFYYDVDLGPDLKLSDEDFPKIKDEMRKIISEDQAFEQYDKPVDEAIKWAQEAKQPYKEELLNDLKRAGTTLAKELDAEELGLAAEGDAKVEKVSFYKNGDFTDLCRGPHVASTGKVGAFQLQRVSGAYWRGNEKNAQMQRIYGVAFATEDELKKHLEMLEEAKKRDHRKLGQELDLFVFAEPVGSGLPLFTPRGTIVRSELTKFSEELRQQAGFEKVWIPHITKTELYKISGHWDKFGDELFLVKSQETSDEFALKPMNCPHHNMIYSSQPRSYRDLPVRYYETTTVYRDEKSGELGGLSRVRSITQDDSHVYCTEEQLSSEVEALVQQIQTVYKVLGMELRARLSFRDSGEGYLGEQKSWEHAQETIKKLAVDNRLDFFEADGEAAFYGPKIDFIGKDALGREHQVATIQLDFVQPERFKLEYTTNEGQEARPIMIHSALLGSIERFLSIYIEHMAGKFPIWLAPEQVRVVTVNQEQATVDFAEKIKQQADQLGVRLTIDNSNESVGKKIRDSEIWKVPYTLVIGEKEISGGSVMPRIRQDLVVIEVHPEMAPENFLKTVANEAKSRVSKTSL